jgi:hypothetical protein
MPTAFTLNISATASSTSLCTFASFKCWNVRSTARLKGRAIRQQTSSQGNHSNHPVFDSGTKPVARKASKSYLLCVKPNTHNVCIMMGVYLSMSDPKIVASLAAAGLKLSCASSKASSQTRTLANVYACMHECMYACNHVCMYGMCVCMYVCMYDYKY